jgi:pyruvate dehydrogenase E2 component (dihydrolipoamide acetyltransferase)
LAIPVTLPRLGWAMEKGVLRAWLKPDGGKVRVGEPLFELEGDKAIQEVEALDEGILRLPPNAPRPGDTVAVGTVIAYLLAPGEVAPWEQTTTVPSASATAPAPAAGPAARRLARELGVSLDQVQGSDRAGRITPEDVRARAVPPPLPASPLPAPATTAPIASPRARRAASELGIDWKNLKGSGRTGRIRERDVRAAATRSPAPAAPGSLQPLTPMRRTIAERMTAGAQTAAPVTLTTTADATNLVSLRKQFKSLSGAEAPSYTDFLIKLSAAALVEHPPLNASWTEEGIRLTEGIHIAFAVDTEAGLLAPVVRDVPSLGLRQVAARTRELIEQARSRRLTPEQMQGGTFSITNLGAYGIDAFTPILNLPQCAILGVGRIRCQPAVIEDRIVRRDEITLSLTFDHRIVDGAPAARFLDTLRRYVEQPGPLLIV